MADSSQEAVAAFMSLTGADAAAAASYIEMAGGVVETAVNLFLEMGSGGSSRAAKLTHVVLQQSHSRLIKNYQDLFERQNGFLGQNKPSMSGEQGDELKY